MSFPPEKFDRMASGLLTRSSAVVSLSDSKYHRAVGWIVTMLIAD
jgi:hypothetical protein